MTLILQALVTAIIPGLSIAVATWFLNRKLESFKHDLIHRVHAKKILLEKELEFYSKLFKVLTDLRDVMAEFTSPNRKRPPDQTFLEWNQAICVKAAEPFNQIYTLTWSYRPFYHESLYPQMDEFLKLTHRYLNSVENVCRDMVDSQGDNPSRDFWKSAQSLAQEIQKTTEELISAVRDRINEMSSAEFRRYRT